MILRREDPSGRDVEFETFVAARSGRLLRTAYLLTGDHQLAEDLLQSALTKLWFAWPRIDGAPDAYVRKVLVNEHATMWHRRWRGERPTEVLPEQGYEADADTADRQDLHVALSRLPQRQRAVIVLRYFDDLTEAETADVLGCTVGTVKSQSAKALAKLRVDATLTDQRTATATSLAARHPEGHR